MAAGYTLFLLFVTNILNVADRSLLGIVIDPIKADLALSDTEMSLVSGTAFVLFNLVVGIFIARWVDRGNRRWILVLGVALWSGATALTGLAQGFVSLGLTRILVGVGEATCMPVAYSMIADLFAAPRRPRAIAIFQASTFIGLVLGAVLAGVLAAAHGWRMMFLMCGLSGFILVLAMIATMREPLRLQDAHVGHADANLFETLRYLLRIPGFVSLSLGVGLAGMAVGALPTWAPAFLLRSHGVSLASVGALIGPAVGGGGILGTLAAGFLATRLSRRHGSERPALWVPIVALPAATPFFTIFAFAGSLTLAMSAAAIMNFLLAMAIGPCIAVAIGMAPARMRAVSSTLMLLASGVIGGALAPLIVGWLSDVLQPSLGDDSLRYGLAALTPAPAIAALLLWHAYKASSPPVAADHMPAD
jgi:MFS family permease